MSVRPGRHLVRAAGYAAALLFVPSLVSGPLGAESAPTLHFERIGSAGGPPPAVITALLQDRDGFIWIGSRNGLTLFDGHGYVTFQHDPSNPRSLSDNTIRTIYEDHDGTLWFGTNTGGLNRFDPATRSFAHYRHDSSDPRSLSHDSVYAILRDRRGRLWVGTQRGLNRFDADSGGFVRILADGFEMLTNEYILTLHEDRAGRLWVGTLGGGLHLWDDEQGRFRVFRRDPGDPESLGDDRITALLEDVEDRLWIGTVDGLSRMDPARRTFHNLRAKNGLQDQLITVMAEGASGQLWIGTHGGGLAELDPTTEKIRSWRHDPARRDSLSDDVIIALLSDRTGALWVGTWGGGLNRLSRAAQRLVGPGETGFPPAGVPDRDVTTLLHDRRGRIWIGTRTGYLVRWQPSDASAHQTILRGGEDGVSRILLDMEQDQAGRVWIGTSTGLVRLDPETGETREWKHDPDEPAGLGRGYVTALLADSRGGLWVGTGEDGLHRLDADGAVGRRFTHDPNDPTSLSDDYVTTVLEDRNGRLWVGTRSGGLNELDLESGRMRRFLPVAGDPTSIGHHYVTSLFQDASGNLWVGTAGGGLNRLDRSDDGPARFERVTEHEGLIDDDVTGILGDDDGSLWISTRNGLSRFHPEWVAFNNYFVSDGLPSAEFEGGAAARSRGLLCFGTVRGLMVLPASTEFERPAPSPVVFRSIRTAAGELPGHSAARESEPLELSYGSWVSIELSVLDYSPELAHRYAYRLVDDWIEIGDRREITFTSLQPGAHALRVRGRNSQGVWSETADSLLLTVVPPFWMTLRFRLLTVAVVVALAFAVHRRRTSVLERRNRELVELHRQREKARHELNDAYQRLRRLTRRLDAAKEDERKRIARELHDDMGPSLTAVIINLQLLSTQPEPDKMARKIEETVDLVDRLVQRIRDISLDLRPPLIDELGLVPALGGYLESIAERVGLPINLTGDERVGPLPADVPIAAFRLVQEAVTNAIRHAAARRVEVTVRRDGSGLDLQIDDDGRGFDVREVLERAATGKALGLLGMQERVHMLDGSIKIESQPGRGTRIRVRLPLEVAVA